jgi:diguanylate cyclase (GGDEF)-like protein
MSAKKAKRGKTLGLVGRVALIACGTAIAATLIQWAVTPVLLRNSFERARLQYAHDAAKQLALLAGDDLESGAGEDVEKLVERMGNPLPGGGAAILAPNGKILAANKHGAEIARGLEPGRLAQGEAGFSHGPARVGLYPIRQDSEVVAFAMISMESKGLMAIWASVLTYNALVFVLALTVFGFFLLPLARNALRPVTELENRIRKRDNKDKSKFADNSDDRILKPLLSAIDEVHDRSEAAMRRALTLAYADPVTRLPNRLRFVAKLESLVDRGLMQGEGAPPGGQGIYLAICDLDGFRKINVSHGPRVADSILTVVAERLRTAATQVADGAFFIGRIGADQFGIIAPGIDQNVVKTFLASAERAIAEPMTMDGHHILITASFGAAAAPGDATTATDLMKQAEIALKEAKSLPAARRAFYDASLQEKAKAQAKLEAEVREGLERGEFVAVFQPKVKLETGELVGAEALARWRRPDGQIVSPGRFVPIAEELGLISKLGNSVMRDACFAAAEWNKKGIVSRIAVNVSPHQFDESDFIAQVYQALDDSGLDPKLLELEITESAAVSDPDRVARIMWPLRNRGVRLAIDDFGTGHSNFASITRLPFDVFKIDQQFIRALNTDPHAPAIVEMILAMAEALGQETVAEGVETKEQADFLVRRNCTIGQGYFYSPPLPAEEFDLFVRSWRPRPANRFAA